MLLKGKAKIEFENGEVLNLKSGDSLNYTGKYKT